ncbi:MAG: hypothetical protein JNL41_05465 [Phenylobacterium sp.]|uniref:hypothetical protein n=1 Tax=Phenylobacterium sp. TaxID=1871053 RepID=UPI001A5C4B7E|nr:hypothetical protein [Phenylobacterium sp.]MBL8553705.1 hypothetical protein [Phenylobacterium sp.]
MSEHRRGRAYLRYLWQGDGKEKDGLRGVLLAVGALALAIGLFGLGYETFRLGLYERVVVDTIRLALSLTAGVVAVWLYYRALRIRAAERAEAARARLSPRELQMEKWRQAELAKAGATPAPEPWKDGTLRLREWWLAGGAVGWSMVTLFRRLLLPAYAFLAAWALTSWGTRAALESPFVEYVGPFVGGAAVAVGGMCGLRFAFHNLPRPLRRNAGKPPAKQSGKAS